MQSTIEEVGHELHVVPAIGCLHWLGLLFGVGISVIAFVPVQQRGGAEWYLVLPVGLGLLAASLYRRRIVIDQNTDRIFRRTKLPGYTRQGHEKSMARFSHVALGHFWKSTKNSRHRVFYVSLSGDESFSIGEHIIVDQARNLAEQLARRLSLPIHDSTSGGVSVIAVNDIGRSLRARIQDDGSSEEPDKFVCQTAQIERQASTLRLSVPRPGYSLRNLARLLPMMAIAMFVMWIVKIGFEPNRDFGERVIAVLGSVFACLCILWPLGSYLSDATREVDVTLDKSELRFSAKTILRSRIYEICVDDVNDIFAFDLKKLGYRKHEAAGVIGGVAIRTEDKTLRFGDHLPQNEQLYLCKLLRYWISKTY